MNKYYWTRYLLSAVASMLYMLQASEYRTSAYLQWLVRANDFRVVSRRRKLEMTAKAKWLYGILLLVYLGAWLLVVCIVFWGVHEGSPVVLTMAAALLLSLPWVVALAIIPPLWVGEVIVQKPRAAQMIRRVSRTVAAHPARKIAIAGSYGKTTMKETLKTILSVKLDTAATPGNLNTPLGTATFVGHLSGQEEVVIFELGESHVGDVAELCAIVQPDIGIITGINEAHLESFGSLEYTADTIFELQEYLGDKLLYKNADSQLVASRLTANDPLAYNTEGVNGWRVSDVKSGLDGTTFHVQKDDVKLQLHSGLLGEYQIGPLVACIDIAHRLGLTSDQIAEGISYTKPFAHRMQPRQIAGAWIIDDTYNGNSQGVAAGLKFFHGITHDGRKIYVTPGLVEQGDATEQVHIAIGKQAAFCDQVVLMRNSTTEFIKAGLKQADFRGELKIIDDPLSFYQNIAHVVKKGDAVLMQNDWTDNYT